MQGLIERCNARIDGLETKLNSELQVRISSNEGFLQSLCRKRNGKSCMLNDKVWDNSSGSEVDTEGT